MILNLELLSIKYVTNDMAHLVRETVVFRQILKVTYTKECTIMYLSVLNNLFNFTEQQPYYSWNRPGRCWLCWSLPPQNCSSDVPENG